MSGTKRVSSETDNVTKKKKSQSPSSNLSDTENTDTTPSNVSIPSKKPLLPKDENIIVELKQEKGATPIGLCGEEDMYYPMEESRQGLVIVNQRFNDENLFRGGAEKDRKYLIEMYEHLDVEYKVKNDLKENEMFDTIEDFSKNIKLPCSVIFVSISTHGKDNGGLMGIEGRSVSVGEIVKCFEKKELLGIPKIFIIQACKGIAKEERECEGDGTHSDSTIPTQYCTKRADVLIAYSTSEGCLSYRNTENGSWFIEVLKDCVTNGRYDSKHLVEILTICTNKIVNDYCDGNRTQTPSYYSTLMKFLKFEKRGKASKT